MHLFGRDDEPHLVHFEAHRMPRYVTLTWDVKHAPALKWRVLRSETGYADAAGDDSVVGSGQTLVTEQDSPGSRHDAVVEVDGALDAVLGHKHDEAVGAHLRQPASRVRGGQAHRAEQLRECNNARPAGWALRHWAAGRCKGRSPEELAGRQAGGWGAGRLALVTRASATTWRLRKKMRVGGGQSQEAGQAKEEASGWIAEPLHWFATQCDCQPHHPSLSPTNTLAVPSTPHAHTCAARSSCPPRRASARGRAARGFAARAAPSAP